MNVTIKNVAKYILTAVISLLVIAYLVYHLIGGFDVKLETLAVEEATQQDTLALDVYIMRNEKILYASTKGDVNYLYNDGEKVAKNTAVADIYAENTSSSIRSRIIEIDRKINLLKNSNISPNSLSSDTSAIDKKIWQMFYTVTGKIEEGDLSYASLKYDDFLVMLNQRRIIVRTVKDYNSQITKLQGERDALMAQLNDVIDTVYTDESGYVYSALDGYEEIFDGSKASGLTISGFHEMISSEPETGTVTPGKYEIGKLVTNYVWYIACEINIDLLHYFETGASYPVIFPYNSDTTINMELDRIVTSNESDTIVLIFKTGTIPDNFNYLRLQTVNLVLTSHTGFKVPTSSVRIVDGKQGVYVLSGNMVKFKLIDPLFESNGYFIVAEDGSEFIENSDYGYISANDLLIIKGKNLYDGKIIE